MRKNEDITQQTLHALHSGSHPESKKYGGKQVFVIEKEVVPLGRKKKILSDFKRLKEKYGNPPVVTFVPIPGATYILIVTK